MRHSSGWDWSLQTLAGYDSKVLADRKRDGVTDAVGAMYGGAENRLRLSLPNLFVHSDGLALTAGYTATGYRGNGSIKDSCFISKKYWQN